MKEEWKEVSYKSASGNLLEIKISNFGNVMIPERQILGRWGYRTQKERLARLTISPNGYYRCMAGLVHRMVAIAFVDKPDSDTTLVVNHLDADKLNNHYTNLEWTTQQKNCEHFFTTNKAYEVGKMYALEVLDKDDNSLGYYHSQSEVARKFGLHKSAISYVVNGRKKTTGGYKMRRITKEEYDACRIKESLQ